MERAQKGSKSGGLRHFGCVLVSRYSLQPRYNAPVPGITLPRRTKADWRWYCHCEMGGKPGQPGLFVYNQCRCHTSTWQAYCQIIAQAKHRVIPSRINAPQGQMTQIWMRSANKPETKLLSIWNSADGVPTRGDTPPAFIFCIHYVAFPGPLSPNSAAPPITYSLHRHGPT